MADRIQGQVAAILNRRELVLNIGTTHGVRSGMRFAVLNSRGLDIRDPDSGEHLGQVEIAKVLVEVVRVQERLAVARTFRTRTRTSGGVGFDTSIFQPRTVEKVPETLEVADKPYEEELSEEESLVKIGDTVVEVQGDEFLTGSIRSDQSVDPD